MKSDRSIYFLGKYLFLLTTWGFGIGLILELINGIKTSAWDSDQIFIYILIGAISFGFHLIYSDKFAMIELGNQKIKINRGKDSLEVDWLDVESISQSRLSGLGLYTLRIKNIEGYFLFGTGAAINIAGLIIDDSELANLIEKKKKDLKI